MSRFKSWLSHPSTRGLSLDDGETTRRRRGIIQRKRFLNEIYREWYQALAASLPEGNDPILEIGSGAGFLKDRLPGVIASDCFYLPGMDLVLDGSCLPFCSGSLRAVVMTDVFHHLANAGEFLAEASRALGPGGVVAMVEPWVTPWSRLIYARFHHEPFLPDAATWEFRGSGPLSGANGALPWIVFQRDRQIYEQRFPGLRIESIQPMMPFRYLLSGGLTRVSLQPGWAFGFWRFVERLFFPWIDATAMFARILLRKGHDQKDKS